MSPKDRTERYSKLYLDQAFPIGSSKLSDGRNAIHVLVKNEDPIGEGASPLTLFRGFDTIDASQTKTIFEKTLTQDFRLSYFSVHFSLHGVAHLKVNSETILALITGIDQNPMVNFSQTLIIGQGSTLEVEFESLPKQQNETNVRTFLGGIENV